MGSIDNSINQLKNYIKRLESSSKVDQRDMLANVYENLSSDKKNKNMMKGK